jgi:hypothetical protein
VRQKEIEGDTEGEIEGRTEEERQGIQAPWSNLDALGFVTGFRQSLG